MTDDRRLYSSSGSRAIVREGAVADSRAVDRSSCSVCSGLKGGDERERNRERESDETRPICSSSVAPKGIL